MGCRIGMATNVEARVQELKAQGLVPKSARVRTLHIDLTYSRAMDYEKAERNLCGPECKGHVGGKYVSGRSWSVYRIDW